MVSRKVQFLAHLLFILYINDLNTISKKLRTIMFADDTNLFMTGKNLDEIKIQLNEELKIFSLWFQANLLSLNISKTIYCIFKGSGVIADGVVHPKYTDRESIGD